MRGAAGFLRESVLLCGVLLVTALAGLAIQRYLASEFDEISLDIDDIAVALEEEFKESIKQVIANDAGIVDNTEVNRAIADLRQLLQDHVPVETPYEIEILVVDSRVVNAMALPGGLIILYVPLIRLTEFPEELAAIMAHEIGHVAHRDPLRKLIRQMGISAVIGLLGGNSMSMMENTIKSLLDLKYT